MKPKNETKKTKRRPWAKLTSLLLAAALIFTSLGILPGAENVAAAETDAATTDGTAELGDLEITGEGTLGRMISTKLAAASDAEDAAYAVTELTISGTSATAAYQAEDACTLVVAVYDEESGRMTASGTADVDAGESAASVALSGDIPQYFTASAYLLDENYAPLCDKYTTELYTEAMQQLEDMTVDDFSDEKVLNLDDDTSTNFAVFNDDTTIIGYSEDTNVVTDNGDGTYTVTNADSSITGLAKGDYFSCTYADGTNAVIKVKSITVDGDTVTVTEDTDVSLEEVFDYVKIEGGYKPDYVEEVENVSSADALESVGGGDEVLSTDVASRSYYGALVDVEKSPEGITKSFDWSETLGSGSASAKLSASGSFNVAPYAKIYLAINYQYVEFSLTFTATFDCAAAGQISRQSIDLLPEKLTLSPVPGVEVSFMPRLEFEASGEVSFHAKLAASAGFAYSSGSGIVNKSSRPQLTECNFKIEATVYLGLELVPEVSVGVRNIQAGNITLDVTLGTQIHALMDTTLAGTSSGDIRHTCTSCLSGDIYGKLEASGTISLVFLGSKSQKFVNYNTKISDFYYSFDQDTFGWSVCPYKDYKVRLTVQDQSGQAVSGAAVKGTFLSADPATDESGIAEFYLENGTYELEVSKDGATASLEVTVDGAAVRETVTLDTLGSLVEEEDEEDAEDAALTMGALVDSGSCGDDATYALDENGLLVISGTGEMDSWGYISSYPWYSHSASVKKVYIKKGITNIAWQAFYGYTSIQEIRIPKSVTTIGEDAFYGCISLKKSHDHRLCRWFVKAPPGHFSVPPTGGA